MAVIPPIRAAMDQPPSGGELYPFADGPVDEIVALVADFYLSYPDPDCRFTLPFSIAETTQLGSSLSGGPLSAVHDRDLRVKDANGVTVFDTELADQYEEQTWGSDRIVVQWTDTETGFVVRIVLAVDAMPDVFDNAVFNRTLDSRTVRRLPRRLTGLKIGTTVFRGRVRLEAGYNCDLASAGTVTTRTGRRTDTLTLDGVAGAGIGRLPGCDSDVTTLRTINNIPAAPGGNFQIQTDRCVRLGALLEPQADVDGNRTLAYSSDDLPGDAARAAIVTADDCTPCRDCSYYVRTYAGLTQVWNNWRSVSQTAESVRNMHAENRVRWNQERECRLANPTRLLVIPEPSCRIFIGGSCCNMSECCLTDVELRFTLRAYSGGVEVAVPDLNVIRAELSDESGNRTVAPIVSGRYVRFLVDRQGPQASAIARFRAVIDCDAVDTLQVGFSVHGADPADCTIPRHDLPDWMPPLWSSDNLTEPAIAGLERMSPTTPT